MAEISDEIILEWERLRASLVSKLQDKGIEILNTATMQEAVSAMDAIPSEDEFTKILNRTATNIRADRMVNMITAKYNYNNFFATNGIFDSVTGVFLPNLDTITDGLNFNGGHLYYLYVPKLRTITVNSMFAKDSNILNFVAPSLEQTTNLCVSGRTRRIVAPKAVCSTNWTFVSDDYDETQKTNLELIDYKYSPRFRGQLYSLKTLIIRDDVNIPSLGSSSNIPNIEEIYVPSSVLALYKSSTNWNDIQDKILAIEGSKYEDENWHETEQWYLNDMGYWKNIYPDYFN